MRGLFGFSKPRAPLPWLTQPILCRISCSSWLPSLPLSLSSSATGRHAHFRPTAESTLELTQSADWVPFVVTAVAGESVLTLTDEATGRHAHFRTGGRVQSGPRSGGSAQSSDCRRRSIRPQSTTVDYDPVRDEFVTTIVGLQDTAELARDRASGICHAIPLRQSASVVRVKAAAIDLSAESILELSDSGRKNEVGDATDHLALSQSASVDRCKPMGSELELTDLAGVGNCSQPRSGLRHHTPSIGRLQSR